MHHFFYHGFLRMDWGLGNPNKTAALIAMLMIAVWGLAYARRWGFWIAVVLFTVLGVCEIDTYSRGGIIAGCVGLGILVFRVPRPWPAPRTIAVIVAFWTIIGASIYLQASERYEQGLVGEDQSVSHRMQIWGNVPRMMVDAPSGWGIGKSGNAYMQWYQPLDRKETYRTLVSSHLTWLVEFGWPIRFLYICAWFIALVLCNPFYKGWKAIPFCIWTTFLIAAFFSSIAESIWLWILPLASLLLVLIVRFVDGVWPTRITWLIPIMLPALILAGLFLIGSYPSHPAIQRLSHQITVGGGKPNIWVVINPNILGLNFGKKVREALPDTSSVGFVEKISQLPPINGETIVVCGGASREELSHLEELLPTCGKLILLNPTFSPRLLPIVPSKTSALIGDLSEAPNMDAWSKSLGQSMIELKGVGNYIDKWPQLILSHS